MSVASVSQPSLPTTGRLGSRALVSSASPRTKARWAADSGRSGTPQLSLNGTQAITLGCGEACSTAPSHVRVRRPTLTASKA